MTSSPSASVLALTTLPLSELRDRLLDLFCEVAYQEGDFTLSSGQKKYLLYQRQAGDAASGRGGVMVGRLLLDQIPLDAIAVAGLTLGADPMVSGVSIVGAYRDRPITPPHRPQGSQGPWHSGLHRGANAAARGQGRGAGRCRHHGPVRLASGRKAEKCWVCCRYRGGSGRSPTGGQ